MSEWAAPDDRELRELLRSWKTIAMVGASSREDRPSNRVFRYLLSKGYRVIPVNPNETEVEGEPAYPSLAAANEALGEIDVVDVFRRAEDTPPIARQAVEVGAKALWLQQGIYSEEAGRITSDAGLDVVMGICMKTVHQELVG